MKEETIQYICSKLDEARNDLQTASERLDELEKIAEMSESLRRKISAINESLYEITDQLTDSISQASYEDEPEIREKEQLYKMVK